MLFVTRRDSGSSTMAYLEEDTPRVLSVADLAGEQVLRVGIDPVRLEAALRSARAAH